MLKEYTQNELDNFYREYMVKGFFNNMEDVLYYTIEDEANVEVTFKECGSGSCDGEIKDNTIVCSRLYNFDSTIIDSNEVVKIVRSKFTIPGGYDPNEMLPDDSIYYLDDEIVNVNLIAPNVIEIEDVIVLG